MSSKEDVSTSGTLMSSHRSEVEMRGFSRRMSFFNGVVGSQVALPHCKVGIHGDKIQSRRWCGEETDLSCQ